MEHLNNILNKIITFVPTYVFNDSGDSLVIGVVAFKFFIFIFQAGNNMEIKCAITNIQSLFIFLVCALNAKADKCITGLHHTKDSFILNKLFLLTVRTLSSNLKVFRNYKRILP